MYAHSLQAPHCVSNLFGVAELPTLYGESTPRHLFLKLLNQLLSLCLILERLVISVSSLHVYIIVCKVDKLWQ